MTERVQLQENVKFPVFTDTLIKNSVSGSDNRRYSLVKRWSKSGKIVRLKRGVYALGEKYRDKGLNLFSAAQYIYGPSYISFESALSYHGWIPEAVYSVTSASTARAREFRTPLGVFSYMPVHYADFFAGVKRGGDDTGAFLIAAPWRALADYVYAYRKRWKGMEQASADLRIDMESFKEEGAAVIEEILGSVRNRRVREFLEGCAKELAK